MGTATLAARVLLAVVFAIAAVTKLPDPAASRATLRDFGAGERLARLGALLAPAELLVAVALLVVPSARWGALGAMLLLLVFIAGIVSALRQGRRPDCGCFGGLRPTPIGAWTLARNAALLALAGFVALAGPGPAIDGWVRSGGVGELALAALVLLAAGFGLIRSFRAAGATAGRADAGRAVASSAPAVGEPAPGFGLDGACGQARTLSSLCALGRPVVLVFGSSGCGACLGLFPHLGRWQTALAERLQIAVVGRGDLRATRLICQDYDLDEVLVDRDGEVWRAYGIQGNPAAFAIGADGMIAGGPAVGPEAIEDLIRLTLHRDEPMSAPWNQTIHAV